MLGLKNTMTELKNSKESLNFRLDQAEEIISELEDLKLSNQRIKMKKRMKKHEESLQELRSTITETIFTLWGSQKERRMRKEKEVYLK